MLPYAGLVYLPTFWNDGIRHRTFVVGGRIDEPRNGSRFVAIATRRTAWAASTDPRQDERFGAVRCPNLAGREGVVVGAGRYRSTVRIKFDGFRSATSLHRTYIEPVAGKEGPSSRDRC